MNIFEKQLMKKENGVRRRVEIDESLHNQLEELAKIYDASINRMVNIAILNLIKTKKVVVYTRQKNEQTKPHNFLIKESYYKELEKLKAEYGLSIFKLINIAIYNAVNSK